VAPESAAGAVAGAFFRTDLQGAGCDTGVMREYGQYCPLARSAEVPVTDGR